MAAPWSDLEAEVRTKQATVTKHVTLTKSVTFRV